MWPYAKAIEALEQKYRQARRDGASWAEDEDGRRPAFQIGSLVAQAIGEGDGWRAARALVAFRKLLGSRFFLRALHWCEVETRRIDREHARREARAGGPVKAQPRSPSVPRAA
jgi:hypothetical protein